ncbi:hypothetical protein GOODEAATRI_034679 [Goodea atripinnis]|uniref:Uncharacterized protein n=1 Tax=Goodea atripinnis TaxID=208336 RepID=A0ABV0MXJ4_9TELE
MFRTEASVLFQKAGSVRTQSKFWGKYVHTLSFWFQVAVTLGQDTPATNSMNHLCSIAGFIELILGLVYFLSETWNKESVRNDEIFLEEPGEALCSVSSDWSWTVDALSLWVTSLPVFAVGELFGV